MNKTCARCEKIVYPTEELKCLDKVWHKGCFKCQGCGMTLNMRTYKGFNKQPYCEAHIPKAKATTMAETPELKRIAENTKIQSNVKYHADFEKSKGKFTQVADDPEILRIRQNSKIISNVAYHGELEKKAAMEQQRKLNENGEYVDAPTPDDSINANNHKSVTSGGPVASSYPTSVAPLPHQSTTVSVTQAVYAAASVTAAPPSAIGKIRDYDPMNEQPRNSPYSARQNQTVIYTSDRGAVTSPPTRKIGSIADIDPINNVYGSLTNPEYQQQHRMNPNHNQYHHHQSHQHQPMQQVHPQQMHQNHSMPPPQSHLQQQQHMQQQQQHIQQQQQQHMQQQQQHMHQPQTNSLSARVYRAMYDYDAQDSDEVSFCEGDLIVNVGNVDSGWMTGTVKRTGDTGMLPANYVEVAHI